LEKDKSRKPKKTYKQKAHELFSTLDKNLNNTIEKEEFYKYYKSE
jgi:Ca2+-binding EF-hand superfamily protein